MIACALTGHRELPPDFNANALYDMLEELIKSGCDTFYCGMAEGFDLLALECLLSLKKRYSFVVEACVPFPGQERRMSEYEKSRYRSFLPQCDRKTVLYERYVNGCYLARDRYMVDRADVVLAYCKKDKGGTAYTVRYAEEKGVRIIYSIEE